MQKSERATLHRYGGGPSSSTIFEFHVQNRIQCSVTGQVKYSDAMSQQNLFTVMELRIPLGCAVNKAEVETIQEMKRSRKESLEKNGGTDAECKEEEDPKLEVPFSACLQTFFADSTIDYLNPTVGQKAPATNSVRLKTFPRYLMIKLGRYTIDSSWRQVKVDARVLVPETLDLTSLKGHGLQPGETAMPTDDGVVAGGVSGGGASSPTADSVFVPDAVIVEQLMSMGFSENGCKRACLATQNSDIEAAMNWIFMHNEDLDFNDPLPESSAVLAGGTPTYADVASAAVDPGVLAQLTSFGFSEAQVKRALKETGSDVERYGLLK